MTALRAFVTVGLAALLFVLAVPSMFQTPPRAYTGVSSLQTGALFQPNIVRVEPGSPAYRAGLRTGDVLGCLSLRDQTVFFGTGFVAIAKPGSPLSACVRRGDSVRSVQIVPDAGPPVPNDYISNAWSAVRTAVFLVYLIVGIALVMARPGLMTWLFFGYCLCSIPSFMSDENLTVLSSWEYAIAGGFPQFVSEIGVSFLLLFAVVVPDDRVPEGWRGRLFWGALVIAVVDVIAAAYLTFQTNLTVSPNVENGFDETLTVLTVLIVLVRLATMQRMERARFGWAALAIILGVVVNDLRNVLSTGPYVASSGLAGDLTILMPLCLMYAILKRHVIDVRFVISRTVVYAALTTLVVAVIGIVDWLTSAYLHQARVAMAVDAVVTIALAFALHRAYGWIEEFVDFVLFRNKRNAEVYLNRMAKTLLRAKREETIDHALVYAPYEKLDLTMAALFRARGASFELSFAAGWDNLAVSPFDEEHELVRFLVTERTKLHIRDLRAHVAEAFEDHGAAPAVAIPLFQNDDLFAFAVYGIHRDGTRLDPDEIETLERLCDVAAQGYTGIELARYRASTDGVAAVEARSYA